MKERYLAYKKLGETPLAALERLRKEESIPAAVPMTYAGRLDPAAEGLLVILAGEECKNKEAYLGLDKSYAAEILLGVSTDTFDLLGLPSAGTPAEPSLAEPRVQDFLSALMGTHEQAYPPYSSKTVLGKQLHAHAKEGNAVALPTHQVTLHEFRDVSLVSVSREALFERVRTLTILVEGDFRQAEILATWAALLPQLPDELALVRVALDVGSGFYVRQLAEDLGRALGTGACLYSLVRTRVGNDVLETAVDAERKT